MLFSGAEIDYVLKDRVGDIDDLMTGDENFSDGCGLISKWLRYKALLYDCVKSLRTDGK